MISLTEVRASKFITCFKNRIPSWDDQTVHSIAFILTSISEDDISAFKYTEKGVILDHSVDKYESDICINYVEKIKSVPANVIVEASKKLWRYYGGESVEFNQEERNLLKVLGVPKFQ
ncbi:hypothetical protein [Metallosphaera hakonensis]|uniref:Uncharacterized protein n=1 Tax=Metallosphaera hakonensis JCM 8857 = DSM 7519 TaxID=1293036 RepID=A0A2U9IVI7_9CREN|nr:hypothetical protein [Metallosphaera hakonensis]AWR99877.1 hypothetical protein DFR87_09445 [Metallosphaera hakonensis JCM 8857 = DSM 7519]